MKRLLFAVLLCLLPLGCALAQEAGRGKSVAGKNWHPLFPKLENFAGSKVHRYSVPKETADGLPVSPAGREGIDVKALVRMVNGIDADNAAFLKRAKAGEAITNKQGCIDSFLLARNGKLVFESYFADSTIDKPHFTMSVTKSIASLGIGKAIELGVIGSDQDLLVDYFPSLDRSKLVAGADKIRLCDLLSMRSGIRVDEKKLSRREKVGRNLEVTSLTLSAPIKPGKEYKYQGTDPNLLSHLIGLKTGKKLEVFLKEKLFAPLGIKSSAFNTDAAGQTRAAAGMQLRSRDLLKIGLMVQAGGKWKGKQVVEKKWIDKSTAIHVDNGRAKYGYFWWSQYHTVGGRKLLVKSARGALGQFIVMVPELEVVAVFTSYGTRKAAALLDRVVLPACVGGARSK
jgi:CubicO group peptidase (beta-lactamase class C family)